MKKRILGILGGMGPEAGVAFCDKLIKLNTVVIKDQDHISFILFSPSYLPDRPAAIINNNSAPVLKEIGIIFDNMKVCGVTDIVVTCNTAHYYIDKFKEMTTIPIIDMIEATKKYIIKNNFKNIGLLGTNITVNKNIYKKYFNDIIVPDPDIQNNVMKDIYDIKGGEYIKSKESMQLSISHLIQKGADVIILGCTEIPLIINPSDNLIDPMEILTKEIINEYCINDGV